jgi:glyoxylase-like metal-dependent hydrolase (beta-lactamase superfamily II)
MIGHVEVEELRPRLWRWTADHPDWTPADAGPDGWDAEVACFALVEKDALVLIDPLVPADDEERFWRALDDDVRHHGPPRILLTLSWHARSAQTIRDRYPGARVWAPSSGEKEARENVEVDDVFAGGDRLPGGVEVKGTVPGGEELFWIPSHGALAAGDVLIGAPDGGARVCPDSWLDDRMTPAQARDGLRPLLELPIELLLLTHGEPVRERGREALERALAA